jgi:hypothetical protein
VSEQTYAVINSEDLAATLTGFAISLVAATRDQSLSANETLELLANELQDLADRAPNTPAAEALELTARMLVASEPPAVDEGLRPDQLTIENDG